MREETEVERNESSLGSDGFANGTRGQQVAALDSSSSNRGADTFERGRR